MAEEVDTKSQHYEMLQQERDDLITNQKIIDSRLSVLDSDRTQALNQVLQKRYPTHSAKVIATQAVNAKFAERKTELIRQKQVNDVRLQQLKSRLKGRPGHRPDGSPDALAATALRIEALLERLCNRLGA